MPFLEKLRMFRAATWFAFVAIVELFLENIPVYWYSPKTSVFTSFYTTCWYQGQPVSRGLYWCTDTPKAYVFSNLLRWRQAVLVPKVVVEPLSFAQKRKPLDHTIPHSDTLIYKRGKRGYRFVVKYKS